MTVEQLIQYFSNHIGHSFNPDGVYGAQCVDLYVQALDLLGKPRVYGNAIDLLANSQAAGMKVIYDAPGLLPKKGDFIVYRSKYHRFGHIALLIEDTDGNTLVTLDQNVNVPGGTGGPVTKCVRNWYDDELTVVGWIRLIEDGRPAGAPAEKIQPDQAAGFQKWEQGVYTVGVNSLRVRELPSTSSGIVATYGKNDKVTYDSVYDYDGYIWVSYVARSGKRRYVAAGRSRGGKNVEPFGRFA